MANTISFKDAADAWYSTALSWSDFGCYDTEPRAEFAEIIATLANGDEPKIPTTVSGWALYSGMKGNGLAAAALTRAARKAVEVCNADHLGLVRFAKAQGWA